MLRRPLQIYEKELLAVIHALILMETLSPWSRFHCANGSSDIEILPHSDRSYARETYEMGQLFELCSTFRLCMWMAKRTWLHGKKNVVADALSRKPQVSAVTIVYHDQLDEMKEQYAS